MVTSQIEGEPETSSTKGRARPIVQSLARSLNILELLAQSGPMRAVEVSEALQLPWATCHRTLSQLEQTQLIERSGTGVFSMGRRTWLLGSTYLVGHRLLDLAVPLMREASEDIPYAVYQLVERSGGVSLVLHSEEATGGEPIARAAYGHHFPLHAGSKGWVLLAYAPDAFIEEYLSAPLLPLTAETVTDPRPIRAKLDEVRSQGYAITVADVQTFTGSVAAPIFDSSGGAIAAVCAVVLSSKLADDQTRLGIIERVSSLAQSLSLGVGWQPVRAARQVANPAPLRRPPGRPANLS